MSEHEGSRKGSTRTMPTDGRLRPDLPPLPARIRRLPVDRGYPVPWFVAWVDGKPEFRAADGRKADLAIRERRCWVCGEPLGKESVFLIGPMCTVNRISAEPPSHDECAAFSARACPFLSRPHMDRRENGLPEDYGNPGGVMIRRNPGVVCLWETLKFKLIREPRGVLFRIGDPRSVRWFAEGRAATRVEVLASMESGLPALADLARQQGTRALTMLGRMHAAAMAHLP
jgi:hypothetical protein